MALCMFDPCSKSLCKGGGAKQVNNIPYPTPYNMLVFFDTDQRADSNI